MLNDIYVGAAIIGKRSSGLVLDSIYHYGIALFGSGIDGPRERQPGSVGRPCQRIALFGDERIGMLVLAYLRRLGRKVLHPDSFSRDVSEAPGIGRPADTARVSRDSGELFDALGRSFHEAMVNPVRVQVRRISHEQGGLAIRRELDAGNIGVRYGCFGRQLRA